MRIKTIVYLKPAMEGSDLLEPWYVYILRCCDATLYVGIAKDVQKRFDHHQEGRGAKYTRTRLPVCLLYREKCTNHKEAMLREIEIKRWSPERKRGLAAAVCG